MGNNTDYYLMKDLENEKFYKLHKFLFGKAFKDLHNDSKLLYSFIQDRMRISLKNKWSDNGRVYCVFTVKEICKMLNVSNKTATARKKELIKYNLLEEKRQYDEPTRYFLKKPSKNPLDKRSVDIPKESVNSTYPNSYNLHTSKTDLSKTELSNTNTNVLAKKQANNERKSFLEIEKLRQPFCRHNIYATAHLINENRSKISKENYSKVVKAFDFFKEHDLSLNELIARYKNKKVKNPSLEHFINAAPTILEDLSADPSEYYNEVLKRE